MERVLAALPLAAVAVAFTLATFLPGCVAGRDDHRLAKQAALSVELAYQAAAIGALAALQTGRYDANQRRCIGKLDDQAYAAVQVARSVSGRLDSAVAGNVALAREAVAKLLDREGC